jgi:hypothetical protein
VEIRLTPRRCQDKRITARAPLITKYRDIIFLLLKTKKKLAKFKLLELSGEAGVTPGAGPLVFFQLLFCS